MLLGKVSYPFLTYFEDEYFLSFFPNFFFFTFQVPPGLSHPFFFNYMFCATRGLTNAWENVLCCAYSNVGQVTFFAGFSTEPVAWITK